MRKAWASQVALVVRDPLAIVGDFRGPGLIPDLRRSPGGGHGNPFSTLPWRILWTEEPD